MTEPAASFELLPAIDLNGGEVVRLQQGDFGRQTAYGADPAAVARAFARSGARWIHVVDLDGAREGRPRQAEIVAAIVAAVGPAVRCEVAGGLRDEDAVALALAAGAARVVVGTAVLRDPSLAGRLVSRFGAERVVVALDVRDGLAVGEGWQAAGGGIPATDGLVTMAEQGVRTFEVTAIARDGLLGGPDLGLLDSLVQLRRGRIVASGGIASLADLAAVQDLGCGGAIVGRALYEGRLDLAEAVGLLRAS